MNPDWNILWSALAGGIGAYFGAYLRQKGQNLATQEDLAQITEVQEAIKSKLAVQVHFGRLRYEREFEVYREVWRAIRAFYSESISSGLWPDAPTGASSTSPSKESWQKAWCELHHIVEDNQPFYPEELRRELSEFIECAKAMAESHRNQDATPSVRRGFASQTKAQYARVEGAIRDRLAKFDDGISVEHDPQ